MLQALGAIGGSLLSGMFAKDAAKKQAALQREFAQTGIQWKVADAKKAGVHPIYALGAQTHSYQPVQTGTPDFGRAFESAGSAVDSAIQRTQNPDQRMATRLASLQVQRGELENALLATQLAKARDNPTTPIPSATPRTALPGQADTAMPGAPERSSLRLGPVGIVPADPAQSDTQHFTDRYGESADYFEGNLARFYDYYYRMRGMPFHSYQELRRLRQSEGREGYLGWRGHIPDTRQYRHR